MKFCSLCKQPMTADRLQDVWKPDGEKLIDVCYVCVGWIRTAFDNEIEEIEEFGNVEPVDLGWLQHVHDQETKPEQN